ncbi:MAG: cellulase family glycosylhydrolase [Bacteroidota bacterium]
MRLKWAALLLFVGWGFSAGMTQSLAHEREARLGTGINFTNWLEAYWHVPNYPEAGKYQRADILEMKETGMKTIRLPVTFQLFTDTVAPYAVDMNHAAMAWVDSVIDWAAQEDMYLVIVNQHGWDLTNDNFQQKIPRMQAMWRQLIQRWGHLDPERYFFEILNEPPVGMLPANVEILMQACIDTIRAWDSTHTLVIDAHSATLGWALATTTPYPDTNLIYTFHTYDPYYFTHQGFSWAEPFPFPTGTPFPFLGDDQQLVTIFQQVADWRDQNEKPVWLGEFGVGIFADATSRCNWVRLVGSLIDQYQLNWLYWDWGGVLPSDFDIFDQQGPSASNCIPCFREALHLYPEVSSTSPEFSADDLFLFPQPAHHELTLRLGKALPKGAHIRILDLQGRIHWQSAFSAQPAFSNHTIPVTDLAAGLYLLEITTSHSTFYRRFTTLQP